MQSISCFRWLRYCAGPLLGICFFAATAAGLRVPYVPTPLVVVDRMLETAKVGPNDFVIDLGSGDGRIVITAAKKYGARGFGVDLNPDRIRDSVENAKRAAVMDRVSFYQQNLFQTDLSQATVITMYLLPHINLELRPKLLELAPGTRLVSHDFDMGDWKPDAHFNLNVPEKYGDAPGKSDVYYWVVPARVAGVWLWEMVVAGKPQSYELRLEQNFQAISGSVIAGGRQVKIQSAELNGADIRVSFTTGLEGARIRHDFTGKVEGEVINGTVSLAGPRLQAQQEWTARRPARPAAADIPLTPVPAGSIN